MRITLVPSALANILAGYLLANQSWLPVAPLVCLLFASACLYCAGMVLNDVFDFDIDTKERPERPLPSGEISKNAARNVGLGLLLAGIALAFVAGILVSSPVRPTCIAIGLAVSVFLYDGPLKRTPIAPAIMGLCRGLNLLLGASLFVAESGFFGFPPVVLWIAASLTVLIFGVTWFAREETRHNSVGQLLLPALVITAGLIGVIFASFAPGATESERLRNLYPMLVAMLSVSIATRLQRAVFNGTPKNIQQAVVSVLRSLIIFDAAACYLAVPEQPGYALAVLCLLIPSLILSRRIAST